MKWYGLKQVKKAFDFFKLTPEQKNNLHLLANWENDE